MAAIAQMRDTAADRTLTWDEAVRGSTGDLQVKRDLDIPVGSACDQKRSLELNRDLTLPFFDVAQAVFGGFQSQLDARVNKERYEAALTRLRRYVGALPTIGASSAN